MGRIRDDMWYAREVVYGINNKNHVVSTGYSVDYGWQTVVYKCNEDGRIAEGSSPVASYPWEDEDAAIMGHKIVVTKW